MWQSQFRNRIDTLGQTQYLNIEIQHGEAVKPALPLDFDARSEAEAPRWFVGFVKPDLVEIRHNVMVTGMPSSEIVIRLDPACSLCDTQFSKTAGC